MQRVAPLPTIVLLAAFVEPMNGPTIPDGAVVVRGSRILSVGPAQAILRERHYDAVHEFGSAVILPGLINAHTHLELSNLAMPAAPDGPPALTDWLGNVVRRTIAVDPSVAVPMAMSEGIRASLRFGVSTVGDITRLVNRSRHALSRASLRAVSFGEVTAMASRRGLLEERIAAAIDPSTIDEPGARVVPGISPHAPYSIEAHGILRCVQVARERNLPLTIHLAESPDEREFLAQHTGAFGELWKKIGGWDEQVPTFTGGPIRLAEAVGLLAYSRTLLAHVNYCDDAELSLLAQGNAGVVYCPRTHHYFGHPPHRWRDMIARGINVVVGTDSAASSPNLNPVDDLRLLAEIAPDASTHLLFDMVTRRAARALGFESDRGQLSQGYLADFAVFPVDGPEALRSILQSDALPVATWIDGAPVASAS